MSRLLGRVHSTMSSTEVPEQLVDQVCVCVCVYTCVCLHVRIITNIFYVYTKRSAQANTHACTY